MNFQICYIFTRFFGRRVLAGTLLVGIFGCSASNFSKSWTDVEGYLPAKYLSLDALSYSIVHDRRTNLSVSSTAAVDKIYPGRTAFTLKSRTGVRLLAVLVGENADQLKQLLGTGNEVVFEAAVTRLVNPNLIGKLEAVPMSEIESLNETPLLQIFALHRAGGQYGSEKTLK